MKDAKGHGSEGRGAHSEGVQQVGKPLNLAGLRGAFNRNESRNYHSENITLLARHFGTSEEQAKAKEVVRERNRIGYRPSSTKSVPDVNAFHADIINRYHPKLYGK